MRVVDLFAGPGGWDVAAHEMGIEPLGIEFDDAACKTREAAGLKTLQADVSSLDPKDFPCNGLIASPPCQAFSMAGKGEGRKAIDQYRHMIQNWSDDPVQQEVDAMDLAELCGDDRAHLVLEPLRWAKASNPEWIALEQVPPVLPIWEAMGVALRKDGYNVWTGILSAEQYGVPQTRKRAFLLARRGADVDMPSPTHQRYVAPKSKTHDKQEDSLFDVGERMRVVHPDDRGLMPWVSMAEALGWGRTDRPHVTYAVGTESGGADPLGAGGSGARETINAERDAGRWLVHQRGEDGRDNNIFDGKDRPSRPITGKSDSWEVESVRNTHGDGTDANSPEFDPRDRPSRVVTTQVGSWALRANAQANAAVRGTDEPAPTITGGHSTGERAWEQNRPSPTLIGDSRIAEPGADYKKHRNENAVRVTQREAAILQSFPADYPWQGSKTKQFQQIGNAVPPLLALAVLKATIPATQEVEKAA